MDFSVLAAFIAAGSAVITCTINIIVSSINSKKSGNLKVIVETRINYMQSLRRANATFICVANPDVCLQCAKVINGMYIYPKELAEAAGTLKTLLKPFYKIENRLIEMINSIEKECLGLYINGTNDNLAKEINNGLATYIKLFAQYDWAYWQFIMQQADGKYRSSNKDFDEVYEDTRCEIVKTYGYDWI